MEEPSSIMSVLGFKEAFESSVEIKINNNKSIKIASIEGLIVLKIIAWNDRKSQNDALDIKAILINYFNLCIGEFDEIYDKYSDLIIEVGGDTEKTGIRI